MDANRVVENLTYVYNNVQAIRFLGNRVHLFVIFADTSRLLLRLLHYNISYG